MSHCHGVVPRRAIACLAYLAMLTQVRVKVNLMLA